MCPIPKDRFTCSVGDLRRIPVRDRVEAGMFAHELATLLLRVGASERQQLRERCSAEIKGPSGWQWEVVSDDGGWFSDRDGGWWNWTPARARLQSAVPA